MLIEATCTPTSVVPSSAPADEHYVMGTATHVTTPFDPWTTSPFWCTVAYVISITPSVGPAKLAFTYNGDEVRTWDIYGTKPNKSGTYTIRLDAEDHVGYIYTGWSF